MNKDEAAKLNEKFRKRKEDRFGSTLTLPPLKQRFSENSVETIAESPEVAQRRITIPSTKREIGSISEISARPDWVERISSEFSVNLSVTENEPENRKTAVSPVLERKASKGTHL